MSFIEDKYSSERNEKMIKNKEEALLIMARMYSDMYIRYTYMMDPERIKRQNERDAEYERIEKYKEEMRLNDLIYAKEKLEILIEEASRK